MDLLMTAPADIRCPNCEGPMQQQEPLDDYYLCARCDERRCPDCGGRVRSEPWMDDPEEMGGSCIGYLLQCEDCDWESDMP